MTEFTIVWTYLSSEPLLWLTATLVAYSLGDWVFKRSGRNPLANPVMLAVLLLGTTLIVSGTDYQTYFEGAQFVHFMLGPATVCLAVPLYVNLPKVRKTLVPLVVALVVGTLVAIGSSLLLGWGLGLSSETLLSLAPKSTTAPVAMGISETVGGSPTLTAVLVLIAGISGAVMATPLLNMFGFTDWRARGFAVGVASHGIGTARAMSLNETAGAFAGIGLGLNALATAILVPIVIAAFF